MSILFLITLKGSIVDARGPHKFGWDPIFQPDGYDKTYAELDNDTKNTISHRRKAINELRKYLTELNNDDECEAPPNEKKPRLD